MNESSCCLHYKRFEAVCFFFFSFFLATIFTGIARGRWKVNTTGIFEVIFAALSKEKFISFLNKWRAWPDRRMKYPFSKLTSQWSFDFYGDKNERESSITLELHSPWRWGERRKVKCNLKGLFSSFLRYLSLLMHRICAIYLFISLSSFIWINVEISERRVWIQIEKSFFLANLSAFAANLLMQFSR